LHRLCGNGAILGKFPDTPDVNEWFWKLTGKVWAARSRLDDTGLDKEEI
jgi:hypothetical protein